MSTPRRIYVVHDNQPVGPFNEQQLAAKLVSGEFQEATLACEEGASAWRPLRETLDPTLLKKTLEFRRASNLFATQANMSSGPQPASSPPAVAPRSSAPPAPSSTSMIGPATPPRNMPAVSLIEPNGTPIQIPPHALSGAFMTSAPVASGAPATPSAAPSAPQLPSIKPTPAASVNLDFEAVGTKPEGASRKRRLQIAGGVALATLIAGAVLWGPVSNWWNARQESARATAATLAGQFEDALVASHNATVLQPDSGVYLAAWQEARRKQLERVKARATQEDPLVHLLSSRDFAQKYEKPLADEGQQAMNEWIAEIEPTATKQIRAAFSRDLAFLNALLGPHEGKLRSYFQTNEQREEAGQLHDQWLALREASAAWDRNEPLKTVAQLNLVHEDLRKTVYDVIFAKVQTLREKLEGQLREAEELAAAHRFLETAPLFAELEPYGEWITAIKVERQRIQMAGENFYASRLVESVRVGKSEETYTSLKSYMDFRRSPLKDDQLKSFLAIRGFKPYLARLTEYGLHPKIASARQNYADVILVASNLPNFDDAAEAREFLRDVYLEWGRQELESGRAAPAAYLALLADKYGNPGGTDLFNKAREKVGSAFTLAIQPAPLVVNAPKASKFFGAQLESDSLNGLRNVLPPWIRWQGDAPAAAGEAEPLIVMKFVPVLAEFNRRNERNVRNASGKFRFEDIIEDNPAWHEAQADLVNAQNNLAQAQMAYQQAQALAQQTAAASANDTSGFGIFGAIISGVTQGVSQAGVTNAQQAINRAQSQLASTPRQVRRENWQTVSWRENDYLSNFDAQFRVDLLVGDKPIYSRKFSSKTSHQSTERDGGFGGRVAPMQKQEPSMDEIENALVEQLKRSVQVVGTTEFLGQIKSSLNDYITQQSDGMDAETRANTKLGLELLWWQHSLFDPKAMKTADLLGRFGDVID